MAADPVPFIASGLQPHRIAADPVPFIVYQVFNRIRSLQILSQVVLNTMKNLSNMAGLMLLCIVQVASHDFR